MLRKVFVFVSLILCFILQTTFFRAFSFGGIAPNLLMILVSSLGFMSGRREGLLVGLSAGLLMDIFFGNFLGFYALIYMYIGYMNGIFRRIFFPEDIKLPISLIVISDLTGGLTCYVLLFLLRGRLDFLYYFTKVILPEALYTVIITLFMYPALLKIHSLLEEREKRSAQKFV